MHLPLSLLPPRPGPPLLDLLSAIAHAHPAAEITLLHSATSTSHSVLAVNPLVTLEVDPHGAARLATHDGLALPPPLNPLAALQTAIDTFDFRSPPPHPLIGWLGFLSYHLAYGLEAIGAPRPDPTPPWPLLRFSLYRHYLLHDPAAGLYTPVALADDAAPAAALLDTPPAPPPAQLPFTPAALLEAPPPAHYPAIVRAAKDLIADGHIYQANLAQRWTLRTPTPPHLTYRRLCERSPAPYAAYLQFHDHANIARHLLSASPELFLHLSDRHVVARPIKGTRPRNPADPAADRALAEDLLASPKDHAELAMIVDLLRNDLGRVSTFGSVNVSAPRTLEQHPTVWHTVATIESDLHPSPRRATLADLLRAALPAGSITGAPKIRACQIINELEPHPRHLYCGHIGAIAPRARSATFNITIRTLQQTADILHLHAGAGITADSDPESERLETLHKAAALFAALGIHPD
ncbi:MAG TPA: anthranilate synthase component I family protein [Phycisphaerae bacterium]|nr:anthranilate synthase component I family protein [Phycisphaerae bacterium]